MYVCLYVSYDTCIVLEKAHKKGQKTVKINKTYSANFKASIQYQTKDKYRQRAIRRVDGASWFWKLDENMDDEDDIAWKQYTPEEQTKLELGYTAPGGAKECAFELSKDYLCDFVNKPFLQFRKGDYERQRAVKRVAKVGEEAGGGDNGEDATQHVNKKQKVNKVTYKISSFFLSAPLSFPCK